MNDTTEKDLLAGYEAARADHARAFAIARAYAKYDSGPTEEQLRAVEEAFANVARWQSAILSLWQSRVDANKDG